MSKFRFHNIKNEKYENWFFVPMLILVITPLLIMGVIAYSIYYQSAVKKNEQQLETYCENICMEYDNIMASLKNYYIDISAKEEFKWMHGQKATPYVNQTQIAKVQSLLEGNYMLMNYISNYNYINVEEGWVLNKYGMFPYDETKNIDEVEPFLNEHKEKISSVYWINHMEVPSPYGVNLIESKMIDLSKELLIVKQHNVKGELSYLLAVQIDTRHLNEIVTKNHNLGFKTVVISDDKALYGNLSEFTTDYVTHTSESSLYNITCVAGYDRGALRETSFVFIWASVVFSAVVAAIILMVRYLSIIFAGPIHYFKGLSEYKNLQVKEMFVSSLLTGKNGIQEKDIKESLESLELGEWPLYRMAMVRLKQNSSKKLTEEIAKNLPEEILNMIFVVPICQNEKIIFLVGEREEFVLDEKTASLYKMIKDFIWEHYEIPISAGISRSTSRLISIQHSHEECLEALHNTKNRVTEHSTLVVYDDYNFQKDYKRNAYDIVIENELVTAIDKGNEEEAYRLLDLSLEILESRNVTGIERNMYLIRLMTAILTIPQNKGYLLNDIFSGRLYEDMSYFTRIYDRGELSEHLKKKMLSPLFEVLGNKAIEEDKHVSNKVLMLIKESKGAISLSECAEQVNYHVNHVGKILKRDTGKTFSELVNEEKMEAAKYLLLTTDYTIAEISEKLSYNNVQNFIRFFKANAHITPSAFRKNHKQ